MSLAELSIYLNGSCSGREHPSKFMPFQKEKVKRNCNVFFLEKAKTFTPHKRYAIVDFRLPTLTSDYSRTLSELFEQFSGEK